MLTQASTPKENKTDSISWKASTSGTLSVNSIYKTWDGMSGGRKKWMDILWRNATPPKVQFFGWLAWWRRVKTAELLFALGILADTRKATQGAM